MIELFEDVAPAAARHLLNRCTPGAGASLQGTLFHKLLAGFGLFGGKRWVVCERFWEACGCSVRLSHSCWHSAHSQWWLTRTVCWCCNAQQHTPGCHCCFSLLAPALTPLLLLVLCVRSSAALFPGGQQVPSNSKLKTTIVGAVSVARDGADFAISLNRALKLDDTHQASLGRAQLLPAHVAAFGLLALLVDSVRFQYGAGCHSSSRNAGSCPNQRTRQEGNGIKLHALCRARVLPRTHACPR